MNKKGLVGIIIILGVLLVVGFFWFVGEYNKNGVVSENEGCVPASCCHSTTCVPASEAPNCRGVFCTMNCKPDTLDCGQGSCEIIDEKCGVVWNEL